MPVVSPDGKYIAFTSDRSGASEFYVIRADGSGELQLTHTYVFANLTELVIVFALFQLPPRVSHLRAFKRLRFQKRFCVFDLLAIPAEENVVVDVFCG
jgi:WD40 repeat protein